MPGAGKESELLYALYDAVAYPTGWAPIAGLIARRFGSESCGMTLQGAAHCDVFQLSATANFTPRLNEAYTTHWHSRHEWIKRASRLPPGVVSCREEIVSQTEFLRSEFFNEWCRQADVHHSMGVLMPLDGRDEMGGIAIHRASGQNAFSDDDKRELALLAPHLLQAMQLRRRLSESELGRSLSLDALDSLDVGIIAADADGRLLLVNAVAEASIAGQTELRIRNGRLRLRETRADDALQRAIRGAAETGAGRGESTGGLFAVSRSGSGRLFLRVTPMPGRSVPGDAQRPVALIFLTESNWRRRPMHDLLARIYRLTPAEARLGEALVNGESLRDYVARHGISINTAKTHRKHLFVKSGHSRQTEFVRDVLGGPLSLIAKAGER